MPVLSLSILDAMIVEEVSEAPSAISGRNTEIKHHSDDSGLILIDDQHIYLVLALVEDAALFPAGIRMVRFRLGTVLLQPSAQGLFWYALRFSGSHHQPARSECNWSGDPCGIQTSARLLSRSKRGLLLANHSTTKGVSSDLRPRRSNMNTSRISNFPCSAYFLISCSLSRSSALTL